MAYVEDWTLKAAKEIAMWFHGGNFDVIARNIQQIIVRHSPLKPDTAYMEIPCCSSCKHWARGTTLVTNQPSRGGFCRNPELRAFSGQQILETAEDFGCVQWSV
jgi:hypothetical protein